MKVSCSIIATTCSFLLASTNAFTATVTLDPVRTTQTRQFMFTGAGAGMPAEDNPEELEKMEQAAKSMGMSLEEYKLGISARVRLTNQMSEARITGGDPAKVGVVRDAHNPPQHLEISITEAGKALGKDAVAKELVSSFKSAAQDSKVKRAQAQKDMMAFIGEEMKKIQK